MATRRERVLLELEDHFSRQMVEAAAATSLLKRELNSLSGSAVKGAGRDLDNAGRSAEKTAKSIDKVGASAGASGKEIDKLSGRMRLFADAAITLGPALIPLGAAAVPAVAALTAGLGAAAGAAGVAVLAFKGVGDALKAVDAYQLAPTTENLVKMQTELGKLGPAGADFARFLDHLEPQLHALQDAARAGLFPGVEDGLRALMPLLPQVERIIGEIAGGMGKLADEAGHALAGDGFSAFFDYLETSAAPTLVAFGHAMGNLVEGMGNLLVAFDPLTTTFSHSLERATEAFAQWTAGLSETEGFRDFVDYVRESGPQIADLLVAVGEAFVSIVEAAAPMGQVVVPVLTALAQTLTAIADSPIGPTLFTAAAGLVALNRGVSLIGPSMKSLNESFLDLRTSPNIAATAMQRFSGAAKIAAGAAGMGLFVTSLHETNQGLSALEGAAGGALAGFSVGGPWGAAVGGAIGLVVSLGHAHEDTSAEVDDLAASFDRQTGAITENTRAQAVAKLQSDGLLDAAQQLGLSTSVVTDAVLGNAGAQAQLNAALAGYNVDHTITSVDDLRQSFSDAEIQTILNDRAATKLRDNLPGLTGVFGLAGAQAKQFAGAMGGTGRASQRASEQILAARSAAARTATSFITLGDSLNDSKVSLSDWIKQLHQQAEALRNFADNAVKAAHRGLDEGLIKSLQEAGPEGAMRMKQLANATDAQLARANRSWRAGQQAIKDYVKTVGGVPAAKATTLSVRDLATLKIKALKSEIASVDRHIDIYFQAHTSRLPNAGGMGPQVGTSADGSTVPKTGLPYADRHLYMLADGEEVISNRHGQADRHRSLLKAINANRLAGGGTTGGGSSTFPVMAWNNHHGLSQALDDLARRFGALSDMGKHELEQRKKMLEHLIALDKHEVDRDKRRHDAMVQELADIKAQRAQLMQSVKSQFSTDIFGGNVDLLEAMRHGGNFSDVLSQITGTGEGGTLTDQDVQNYLASLSPTQIAALQARAGLGQLNQDASNADAFQKALKEAKKHGLSGGLLRELEQSGNLQAAQQFASMSAEQIAAYEKAYRHRQYEVSQTAQMIGNDQYGAAINAQTKAVERSADILAGAQAELKLANRAYHRLEHRLNAVEKATKHVGQDTAHALNGSVRHGQRKAG